MKFTMVTLRLLGRNRICSSSECSLPCKAFLVLLLTTLLTTSKHALLATTSSHAYQDVRRVLMWLTVLGPNQCFPQPSRIQRPILSFGTSKPNMTRPTVYSNPCDILRSLRIAFIIIKQHISFLLSSPDPKLP